ncbi:Galactosylgalactosylxylosylprotein 3-beta-glucuronosyltransferase P [Chionoecetes opilio]|uniref:Galactosylgalactosylxylosylprotein 3-beta-glucuronosyltransferase n=1 Tax=Chionoecetes opilio TaxID=41210 RepID=A0A8J4Y9I3_CHIOP|nr:Galactosylgalactosylxylosylprotein 3-beta-glucuronosyltransferase P [Chionoecetes opilio]
MVRREARLGDEKERTGASQRVVCGAAALLLVLATYWLASQPTAPPECGASLALLKAMRDLLLLMQVPELTRLAQTLMLVPRVHWVVAEDAPASNMRVVRYLLHTGLPHTYLLTPMPEEYRNLTLQPKGVANRNGGLAWVRTQAREAEGVVYFADDDNTYDIRLFEEMRYTKRVSMWPVGLIRGSGVSTPVMRNGRFAGWYDAWIGGRKFPVDMAGFAVSVRYLLERPDAQMPYTPGHEEDGFLTSLGITPSHIEFKAAQCTQGCSASFMSRGMSSGHELCFLHAQCLLSDLYHPVEWPIYHISLMVFFPERGVPNLVGGLFAGLM